MNTSGHNERSLILLKALVERYIAEGVPVGSRTLSKHSGLDLSPASIRNIMSDLEEMGLITSPHTSAGRIPTPRGYRLFVDNLLTVKPLDHVEISQLEGQLHPDQPQRLLACASQLLSDLTHFAGVVMAPRRSPRIRQVEFLKLSDTRLLLIIVTNDGDVQNRILFTDRSYSPSELVQAANFLNQHCEGSTLEEVKSRLHGELREIQNDIVRLMNMALTASQQALDTEECLISGERNLLNVEDISGNMERLRRLFGVFDQKTGLMQLLDTSMRAEGVKIFIGGESGMVPLDECSVVTAPYEVDGQVVGTIAVVGPQRMSYERVIPIVDVTAKLLSSALSQH